MFLFLCLYLSEPKNWNMKTKKFFNGNLVIGKTLYNFLYTVVGVFVLLVLLLIFAITTTTLFTQDKDPVSYYTFMGFTTLILFFVGHKIFNENNYI